MQSKTKRSFILVVSDNGDLEWIVHSLNECYEASKDCCREVQVARLLHAR